MVKQTQLSFSAGEIAPELRARTDIDKYSIALASLKNGYVLVGGGVSNRAGTEFVCEVKDSSKPTRVLPFSFNTEQTYIIEVGEEYFRFIQNGGQIVNGSAIVETITTFQSSELFDLKYAQSADVLTICHKAHVPQELSRTSNILWPIVDVAIEPTIAAPTNVTASHSGSKSSSVKNYYYKVTAIKNGTNEESVSSSVTSAVEGSVEGGWVLGEKITVSWTAVSGASGYNVYKQVNGVDAYAGTTSDTSFVDDNIDPDLTTCIPIYKNPFDKSIMPIMTSNSAPSGFSASISSEDSSHKAFNAFDRDNTTYAASTSLPATLIGTMSEGKIAKRCVIKPKDNAPSAYTLIGRKAGDDTVAWANPKMTSMTTPQGTVTTTTVSINYGVPWAMFSNGDYCICARGVVTKYQLASKAFISKILPMTAGGDAHKCTSCSCKTYLNGAATDHGSITAASGKIFDVPLEFDTIEFYNFVGGYHPDLIGFTSFPLEGYTGGQTEVVLYTSTEALTANTETTIELPDNETVYTSCGVTVTANTSGSTAQIIKLDFQEDSNYPGCVAYFQQRKHFADTLSNPNYIESSQTQLFNNFNVQRPLLATNAVSTPLFDGKMNEIMNLMAADNDLMAFTAEAEWRINGQDGSFEATPPPIPKKQSAWGSCNLMPLYFGDSILFVQAGKNKIRDLEYTYAFDKYKGNDLTYLANHLFNGKQIVDWAFSREPNPTIWAVMSDGTLNALTYYREQQVLGWHHHDTDGLFESVAVVRESYEDVPYFVIQREIDGQDVRYIERMKSRQISDVEDGFFVDCGLKLVLETAVTTISNLEHLEGKTVSILADGKEVKNKVVTDGAVTLTTAAKKIVVGLPYTFEMQTLNFEGENTQGNKKIVNSCCIKVDKAVSGFGVEGNVAGVQTAPNNTDGTTTNGLFSGDMSFTVNAEPSSNSYLKVSESRPFPITVLSISPKIEVTDGESQQGQGGQQ